MIPDADLDHVALAAERQDELWPRYAGDLGGRWLGGGGVPGFDSAQVAFANGMKVETLEPYLVEQNDFLRRFLDRNGPGPHHLTFKVGDLAAALERAEEAGYRPVNVDMSNPGWMEAFLHPKDAPGVVVQLAQSSAEGDWGSPVPAGLPGARDGRTATLVHVAHAVADLDEGLRLFERLLGGRRNSQGATDEMAWVDLAWPGPGRIRLVRPTGDGPVASWLGERAGRVHHLAFACHEPEAVAAAKELRPGFLVVEPADNLGTRLLLADTPEALAEAPPF